MVSNAIISMAVLMTTQAQANLISQYTEISSFQRNCPGLSDPNYAKKWNGALTYFYGASFTTEQACHFNGGLQSRYYKTDGTPKPGFDDIPSGVAFSGAEVGSASIIQDFGADEVEIGNQNGDYYGKVKLDNQNLGLPELKVKAQSGALERDSINGFAASLFEWQGAATTSDYKVDFDLFNSGGEWALDGAMTNHDYMFSLYFGVSQNMVFSYQNPFSFDYGTILTSTYLSTKDLPLFSASMINPYNGSLSISFDVNTGDRFWLWGTVQAFGFNGGLLDASHTVTSKLAVDGLTEEQNQQLFASALQQVPNQVPTPAAWSLWLIGLLLMARTRLQH